MTLEKLRSRARARAFERDFAALRFCSLQDDMVVANGPGATVRGDLNNQLQSLVSNNSGSSAPSTTYAYMWWVDTTNGLLKQRNAANSGWITKGKLTHTDGVAKVCCGRLTLASGTPVPTADQTAKTNVYFTPYLGDAVALYTSSEWRLYTFTELSVAVPSTTNTPFDVFLYDNAGTLTLETVDWSSDSARATALTTQDGVNVKNGATSRRYLGTLRTTAVSGQAEDSEQNRLVFNAYNRVMRKLKKVDTTASWSYTTTSWRSMNNSTANRVAVMAGLAELTVDLTNNQLVQTGGTCYVGIDVDGTSASDADVTAVFESAARAEGAALLKHLPAVGYHYYQAMEYGGTTGTFHGAYGAGNAHGLTGTVLI